MKGFLYSVGLARPDIKKEGAKWRREIRSQQRQIDSRIRAIEVEELMTRRTLKEAAKRGDMKICRILAEHLVVSRRTVIKLRTYKGQLGSLALQIQEQIALSKVSKDLVASARIATTLGDLIKVPQLTNSISVMTSEILKAGLISDSIGEAVELAQSNSDIEEEAEDEINKIIATVSEGINKEAGASQKPTPVAVAQEPVVVEGDLTKDLEGLAQRFQMLKS